MPLRMFSGKMLDVTVTFPPFSLNRQARKSAGSNLTERGNAAPVQAGMDIAVPHPLEIDHG